MKLFSQAVCEKIGYYVYILKDPRNSAVFYVGKGNGDRVFQHIRNAEIPNAKDDKLDLIRQIGVDKVEHYILRHELSEKEAENIESACIDILGLENLTNKVKGKGSWKYGIKTVHDINQYYDAKIITITEPALIININRLFHHRISPQQLYDATRSSWILGSKRLKVKYALASYRGLVREVYKIDNWAPVGQRWEFTGQVAEPAVRDKYLDQSLDNYIKKGSQNPIKYTF